MIIKTKTTNRKLITNFQTVFPASGDTATASVTITVNDVNEAPSFTLSSYSGEIAENSANGVDIITITATDPDSGDTLTYSLSGSGEF